MEITNINEKILTQNPKYKGYESNIYEYEKGILVKVFHTSNLDILNNKRKKLEILSSSNFEAKPISLVSINGTIKGYLMNELIGYIPLNCFKEKLKTKLEILHIVLKEIELLHTNNIIFGDISLSNILIQDNKIAFCDLDNMKIGPFHFDTLTLLEKGYLKKLELDEYLDYYIFNLFTITYLCHIAQTYTINYIHNHKLPFILNNDINREIVKNMLHLNHKESITPFIDHTKRYHLF